MEVAKALGGSFKLVTLTPKTKGNDSTARKHKRMGTQTNQRNTNEYTKYKPRLNTQKKYTQPNRAV